ncbi:MAG: hypothetical protein ABUS51_03140 [Acidobacteriota bacterium]
MATFKDPRRGGILGGVLFTGLAIVVLMMAAGLFIVRNVRVATAHRYGGDDVSIETPGGRLNIRAHEDLDPAAIGLPIYPGATRTRDSGVATFEWTSADGKHDKGMAVGGASLFTPDPESKVLAYYREQLPNWLVVTDRDGSTRFELRKDGFKRIIAIHEKSDGTHIGVASIGDPASN